MEEKLEGPPGLGVMTSVQVSTDPTTDGQRRARVTVKFLPLINRQQSKGTVSLSIARQRQATKAIVITKASTIRYNIPTLRQIRLRELTRSRNVRSNIECSACPAIHTA